MAFENTEGKEENAWLPAFSPFLTVFSTLSNTEILILAAFNLSSANALNLLQSRKLSFDKGLTHYQTTNFRLFQTERVC